MLSGQSDVRKIWLRHIGMWIASVSCGIWEVGLSFGRFLPSKKKVRWLNLFFCVSMASIFEWNFELRHTLLRHVYTVVDPNAHGQWARPSIRVFILKELNAAEYEGLACETSWLTLILWKSTLCVVQLSVHVHTKASAFTSYHDDAPCIHHWKCAALLN